MTSPKKVGHLSSFDQLLRLVYRIVLHLNLEQVIDENKFKSYEHKELMCCMSKLDETDRTILAMKGAGHDYDVIQKFIGNISKNNLRTRAKRARALLADCMGRKKK